MSFTANDVMTLRQRTGAGMMDCKKALVETDGDMEKAVDYLREKGIAKAAKKSGRIAAEGIVDSYIHMGGKVGVLLEVNCETDFVARGDQFKELVHDIALQIAAANPSYVAKEEMTFLSICMTKLSLPTVSSNLPHQACIHTTSSHTVLTDKRETAQKRHHRRR